MNHSNRSTFRAMGMALLLALPTLATGQVTEEHREGPPERYSIANFGTDAEIDGDWAVVADERGGTPMAYVRGLCTVYKRTDQGWAEWQVLLSPSAQGNQYFAKSMALDGDELVIGAFRAGPAQEGRVYVYRLLGGTWTQVQELRAFDEGPGYEFGWSLDFDGETIVVGAPGHPPGLGGYSGAGYVYRRGASGWELSAQLFSPDALDPPHHVGVGYARVCAVDRDVLVIAAPWGGQGVAHVYRRSVTGWTKEAKLFIPQPDHYPSLKLGASVAIESSTIALGAPGLPGAGGGIVPKTPRVWMYDYDPASQRWQQSQSLWASDWDLATLTNSFGASVAMEGNWLLVGAPLGASNGQREGSAHLFERVSGTWIETQSFITSDPNIYPISGAQLGTSVALDAANNRVLLGAIDAWSEDAQWYSGKAYFYDLNQGAVVCGPFPNAVGNGTRLTVTGNRTVQDANVALSIYDAPPDRMGIFLVGAGGTQTPFGTAGASLCVGQPFSRLSDVQQIGPGGSAMLQLDFTTSPANTLIFPGSRLTFQFVHRATDFLFGTQTINASEAVEVLFE